MIGKVVLINVKTFEAYEFEKPYSEETLRRAAYHEGGHALVSELLDPGSVSIASIRPSA